MGIFNVAKTLKLNKDFNDIIAVKDRLIIQKNNNIHGTAYYEYANTDGTIDRLKLSSSEMMYYSNDLFVKNILEIQTIESINIRDLKSRENITSISINTLISDGENIGIIESVDVENNDVNIIIIYKAKPILWNDYKQ